MYTAKELEKLPTLCVGQADSLKIEKKNMRVWLCRCGIADGMPYDEQVTIEKYVNNKWVTTETYEG
jgi:CDGSH-type Zn-finger protein